ncbi:MAG: tripartite tricarboxylate transporter substrate-binding protein, partial [Hyphomicrobiales bacterium]
MHRFTFLPPSVARAVLLRSLVIMPIMLLSGGASFAQNDFPSKPIRFVVPYFPGGTPDIQGRRLAEKLRDRIGQAVIVDNRPGANASIGLGIVARAPADGYTISLASSGVAISATLVPNLPFDPVRDFAHLTVAALVPNLYVIPGTLQVANLKEFVALVKQKPGGYN